MNRRELIKRTGLAAAMAGAVSSSQTARSAANDRVGVGVIGCGNQGGWDQRSFMEQPDVDIVAVCDVYEPNLQKNLKLAGGKAKTYHDYRRLLEDKNVQAVIIATPEHWHGIMTIDACDAGKDVYVEKPVSTFIREGRLMVDAARRNKRIVQVGSQQRSGSHYQRAVKYIQDGRIGQVLYAICWNHTAPSSAARPPAPAGGPPPDLDYDMWLGPAPMRPYSEVWNTGRRSSWDYSGGMITGWGPHTVDVVLWAMGVQGPKTVTASGGSFRNKGSQIPDTLQVLYEYDDFVLQYSVLSHNTFGLNGDPGAARQGSYGNQFHGTKGTIFIDRAGFRLTPQYTRVEDPLHGPRPSYWSPDERTLGVYYTTDTLAEVSDSSVQHQAHPRHFIDAVKSRAKPIVDIEDGHYANTVCRLGNIAYRVGRKIRWDNAKEQAIGDPEADKLVAGTYRAPWIPKGL